MSQPHHQRGEVWLLAGAGHDGRAGLVVSGTMFNTLTSEPNVIAVPVTTGAAEYGLAVDIGQGHIALPSRIVSVPKALFHRPIRLVSEQHQTDVYDTIFKILTTE
jgi:mRNA-degrading endonuclease toxin of MazEF toxin-antitoxin module